MEQSSEIDASSDQTTPRRSRLLVLLFSDLVGSTGLKDQLTTAGYLPLLRRHDELLRQAIASAGGALQQDTGDGCFATFTTPSDAVRAALLIQWKLNKEPWPAGCRLSARVGIHLGEVAETEVRQDGGQKLVGVAVDIAARVMSLAQGGQILLTRGAFNDARQFVAAHCGDGAVGESVAVEWIAHGPYLVKGSEEPVEVFEVGVAGQAPLTAPPDSEKARRALRPGEEQTLGWRPAIGLPLPGAPLWVFERKLGEGGFGEVWLARHAKAQTVRVFKFCFDAERLRALKREVVLFRLLKQTLGDRRDISRVIDWRFDEPPYFIEMEYVAGGNLADWAEQQGGIGNVPLADRLRIVAQVATALSAAHSAGILHKDIKPSNVMMAQDGDTSAYPRLTDFGIGILTDRDRLKDFNITAAGFTASNITVNDSSATGTRMYAPPESLAGQPHTLRGDIYALGVLLYQIVVGDLKRPIGVGWERQVEDKLLREDIAACVDMEPSLRLSTAAELADRLEKIEPRRLERRRQEEQAQAERVAREQRAGKSVPRPRVHPLWSMLAAGAVFCLLFTSDRFGTFQHPELKVYDRWLRLEPADKNSPVNIIVIGINDHDITTDLHQPQISDHDLAALVKRIEELSPAAIGIDLVRDMPVPDLKATGPDNGKQELAEVMAADSTQFQNVVASMREPAAWEELGGYVLTQMPGGPAASSKRAGFSDILEDTDGVVRRGLIATTIKDVVHPVPSFAMRIAVMAVHAEGIRLAKSSASDNNLSLGKLVLVPLRPNDPPYRTIDSGGFQTLIDFKRRTNFHEVSYHDASTLDSHQVHDAIVLIGRKSEVVPNYFITPLRRDEFGVELHAMLIDQIVRTARYGGARLHSPPGWATAGLLLGWCVLGGILASLELSPLRFACAVGAGLVLIPAAGFGIFCLSLWVPTVVFLLGWLGSAMLVWRAPAMFRRRTN